MCRIVHHNHWPYSSSRQKDTVQLNIKKTLDIRLSDNDDDDDDNVSFDDNDDNDKRKTKTLKPFFFS